MSVAESKDCDTLKIRRVTWLSLFFYLCISTLSLFVFFLLPLFLPFVLWWFSLIFLWCHRFLILLSFVFTYFRFISLFCFFPSILLFVYFYFVLSSSFILSLSFPPLTTCSLLFFSFLTSQSIFIVLPPHSHPSSLSNAPFSFHSQHILSPFFISFYSLLPSLLTSHPFYILLSSSHFPIISLFCCFFFPCSCFESFILFQTSFFPLFLFLVLLHQHLIFLFVHFCCPYFEFRILCCNRVFVFLFFYFLCIPSLSITSLSSTSACFLFCSPSLFSDTFLSLLRLSFLSLLTRFAFPLSSVRTHTHIGGEVGRLVLACHLSSALTLALITASPLANAASLGLRSMCSRHKRRREFALGNASPSHYGIRKSVWCERQFTPAAKRSFCFSLSLSL